MTGCCTLSAVPVRAEPGHRSEMINQLLFADTYHVLSEQNGWLRIATFHDGYEGWIHSNQHTPLKTKPEKETVARQPAVVYDLVSLISYQGRTVLITCGTSLPEFDGLNFRLVKEKITFNGQAVKAGQSNITMVEKIASRFLGVPYLWGGRSPFGIDCSGFTQVVFKFMGVNMPRDAYQQAVQGEIVNFVSETKPGDLAFFSNEEGKIIHVGIVLSDERIIHASGRVRIDRLDHFGIFNQEIGKYTHQLKIIKRVV
ncbi:MAG: C40 family peptidase [Chitinophagales bacterium]|nr:C40 family peptidase [Chitinophagales bacterium]MDW8418320.1 C40 family peptidase [Chitinophagales bacterium]